MTSKKRLVIIDSNSLLNRAFYALPLSLKTKDGLIVNAVFGYINMLSKIISDLRPTHIAATFDLGKPTFRHIKYKEYKATRRPMPPELAAQMPVIRQLLKTMGINPLEKESYEADDLIGTLAKHCDYETYIVTGDRDLLQMVDKTTRVWLTKKGVSEVVEYTLDKLTEEGIEPINIIDLKALTGDVSDNIPGVKGIGEKTAFTLIAQYKNIENIYANIDEIQGKTKDKLIEGKSSAYMSKDLATIDTDAPIDCSEECYKLVYPFPAAAKEMLSELAMKSAIAKFDFSTEITANAIAAAALKKNKAEEIIISGIKDFKELLNTCEKGREAAFCMDGDIHLSFGTDKEYILKISYDFLNVGESLLYTDIISALNDSDLQLTVFDYKTLKHTLQNDGLQLNNVAFDVMLAAYLVDSNENYSKLDDLLEYYAMPLTEKAEGLFALSVMFKTKLSELKLDDLYYEIDFPLIDVLFDMENAGFRIDKKIMEELSLKYTAEINSLKEAVYLEAGEKFNINSPKQLNGILYDKLKLPALKKNKTGYSSSADILAEIADLHAVIPIILKYRQYTKLQSTYIDGFRNMITTEGRIHTVFRNALTTTGRLSSIEPNMQNIPVRDSEGREIRKMFIASEGCKLISADYSQIELRLMADFSGDANLIEAFQQNLDVHSMTASKIFNVEQALVTREMRRAAKAVNFGIIYGISDFGLSTGLGIKRKEAKQFIEKYFELYPAVKEYMNQNVAFAKEHGYIKTYFGRIRFLPEIKSSNFTARGFGERAAMNMPLQGSAADIIKKAMINVAAKIKENRLETKLIMTVHDELVADAPINETETVKAILKSQMENVVKLKVPLTVSMEESYSWLH
ncbi:MAG: DNA polymerase I [Clostridiales bacterium]|jgi:DNA polymerase-1|nr:DNA polymerase I [Clostridiales bacterium]